MIKEHDNFIYFLRLLNKYTDYNHPLSVKEIMEKYNEVYNEHITKQTVYNYLSMAESMDIDIINCPQGKYLASRQIEEGEATFLIHSIISNRSLNEKYSKDLINKIMNTQSKFYDPGVQNIYVCDKKNNRALLLNVDLINKAIREKKKISFIYSKYNYEGQIVPYRKKKYTVSPLFIISRDSKIYLVAKYDTQETIFSFRVDKIIEVKITEYPIEVETDLDPKSFAKHRLYMYSGKIQEFVLRCDEKVLDDVFDNFGKNIKPFNIADGKFDVKVKTTEKAIKFFASQYIKYVAVIYPTSVKDAIKDDLREALSKYY